jgi:RNA polymerase sigma factor (TIGR02999 family)
VPAASLESTTSPDEEAATHPSPSESEHSAPRLASAQQAALTEAYDEMKALARSFLSSQRPDHTLQPTALVHEAWLRLADHTYIGGLTRGQLLGVAATAMRHVLVDHARRHRAVKRGSGAARVPLDETLALYEGRATDLLALDEALGRLAAVDPRLVKIVELRFFGGLKETEIADILECSARTVRREWALAQRWLNHELS